MSDRKIKLKNNSNGACTELGFVHALAVLKLQQSQGRSDWSIEGKQYKFTGDAIVRNRRSKKDREESGE